MNSLINPFPSIKIIPNVPSMNGIFHSLCQTITPINKNKQIYLNTNSDNTDEYNYQIFEQVDKYVFITTANQKESYITIEFPYNLIYLTNFSIKVGYQSYYPKKFLVKGYNGRQWLTIKTIEDSKLCPNNNKI